MSANWTFFTNHGHLLFILSMRPEATVLEMANEVGITERAARRIIADLARDGFIEIEKKGRKNSYRINKTKSLKHPIEQGCTVGELSRLIKRKN